MITEQNIEDICSVLSSKLPDIEKTNIGKFERILGGADTEIFWFRVKWKDKQDDFILRIYRKGSTIQTAKSEYEALHSLFNANLAVPKPFGFLGENSSFGRPFLIMEKIDGELLADAIFDENNDQGELIFKFMENLVKLHSFKWKDHFKNVNFADIESDPYSVITRYIQSTRMKVEHYDISELKPLIAWLLENMEKYPCKEVVLIHGDYHANNIILKPSGDLITLDWANIFLGDRRLDIAFSIVAIDSADLSLHTSKIQIYEKLTGKQVLGIEYFMVLSNLHNFLRIYSMLANYEITGENDTTRATLIEEYRNYSILVLNTIKSNTGLSFPTIENALLK